MSDTSTLPDADVLSALEFDPECGLYQQVDPTAAHKCHRKALWLAFLPCCQHGVLFCGNHASTVATTCGFKCLDCGVTHYDRCGFTWRMI